MKTYWSLFKTFFKIGLITFGGGYAMLPILRREVVENHGWCTEEELGDYYAIGQCTPGIIAVNTATFIGYKQKGLPGGIVATYSLTLPSFIIILLIAALLQNFAEYPVVQNAFMGIRVAVTVLIAGAVVKLFKTSVKDKLTLIIFLIVLALAVATGLSPVLIVVAAGVAGVVIQSVKGARERK
ncbi:MAG: chromate transporter [Oscillospiraceae bacterium]|nr:chromate transporter [Oscillospiraceae bacterium]